MTDRATLLALAERCEKAEGPDRELDAAIFVALTPEAVGVERPPLDGLIDSDTAGWLLRWDPPRRWSDSWRPILRFTASLDAALTLVPDEWKWTLHSADAAGPPCAYCVPDMGRQPWPVWVDDITAATPALALCAAALRARAAEVGE